MRKILTILFVVISFVTVANAQTYPNQVTQIASSTEAKYISGWSFNGWINSMKVIVVPSQIVVAEIHTPRGNTITVQKFTDGNTTCYYSESSLTDIKVNCVK